MSGLGENVFMLDVCCTDTKAPPYITVLKALSVTTVRDYWEYGIHCTL